jgi:hypothetical protein
VLERTLTAMRDRIRTRRYVMTVHAEEEMDADGLSIFDIENAILTGRIVARQVERPLGERKYVVRGRPLEGEDEVVVVVKMGPTGKLVILTVYSV